MIAVSVALLWVPSARAQSVQGSINGTVKDQSGAVIAGATITLVNQNTQFVMTVPSDDRGNYQFPIVDRGVYTIKAELVGFKSFVNKNLPIETRDALRVDIAMELGEVTETIEVSGDAAIVRTEDAQLTFTLNNKRWLMPARHRNQGNDRRGQPS